MEKSKVKNIWEIVHRMVDVDNIVFSTTYVKAETAGKALAFFNSKIADDNYVYKTTIEKVYPFKVYNAEGEDMSKEENNELVKKTISMLDDIYSALESLCGKIMTMEDTLKKWE